jgi:hypothetical protein
MKKYIFLSLFSIAFHQLHAQFHLGLKAGYNNASATSSPSKANSSISAFQAGAFATIHLTGPLSLQVHALYDQKGSLVKRNDIDYSANLTYRINYLETGVSFQYKLPIPIVNISIGAGPYVATALSGTEKGEEYNFGVRSTIDRKLAFSQSKTSVFNQTYLKNIDLGFDLNASAKLGKYKAYVNYGLGIVDRGTLAGDNASGSKNRVFTVGVGFYFL